MTLLECIGLMVPVLGFLVLDSHHESGVYHTICKLTQEPCGSQVEAPCHLIAPTIATYPFFPCLFNSHKIFKEESEDDSEMPFSRLTFIPSARRPLPLLSPPFSMFLGMPFRFSRPIHEIHNLIVVPLESYVRHLE